MSNGASPILITGITRSGTSMTAGIIHLCGAWAGKSYIQTKRGNRRVFENVEIRDKFTVPMMQRIGCSPGDGKFVSCQMVHDVAAIGDCTAWRDTVLSCVAKQGYKQGAWFYKSSDITLLWHVWHAAFPGARWVLVRRDAEDIVRSCLRTGYMRPYTNRSGWLRWVAEYEERFEEMYSAGLDMQEVWPQRMVDGDFSQIELVVRWLGLDWDGSKAREFVDPKLWRRGRNWERVQNLDRR